MPAVLSPCFPLTFLQVGFSMITLASTPGNADAIFLTAFTRLSMKNWLTVKPLRRNLVMFTARAALRQE